MSKRSKTLTSFFQVQATASAETGPSTRTTENIPRIAAQLKPGDVEPDPGKRIAIEDLDPDIRDLARRQYISMGPCQPTDHTYERTNGRSFHDKWIKNHRKFPFSFIHEFGSTSTEDSKFSDAGSVKMRRNNDSTTRVEAMPPPALSASSSDFATCDESSSSTSSVTPGSATNTLASEARFDSGRDGGGGPGYMSLTKAVTTDELEDTSQFVEEIPA